MLINCEHMCMCVCLEIQVPSAKVSGLSMSWLMKFYCTQKKLQRLHMVVSWPLRILHSVWNLSSHNITCLAHTGRRQVATVSLFGAESTNCQSADSSGIASLCPLPVLNEKERLEIFHLSLRLNIAVTVIEVKCPQQLKVEKNDGIFSFYSLEPTYPPHLRFSFCFFFFFSLLS